MVKRKQQMKRQEKRTEIIHIRITPTERRALEREAKRNFRLPTAEAYKRLLESLGMLDDSIDE